MKSAIVRTFALILIAAPFTAAAYSVSGPALPDGQAANNSAVTLPQLPAGAFNLNWNSFLNSLPIQGFISSLQSAGQGGGLTPAGTVSFAPPASAQNYFGQIDAWTQAHFGFQLSALIMAVLGILSWLFGLLKTIIDWLIGYLK